MGTCQISERRFGAVLGISEPYFPPSMHLMNETQLSCLSSVLRQLMVFHTDVHRFVTALKERLGPQIQNVPLLYQGTPELRDVLALLDIHVDTPKERLSSRELRARFQTLVENVFTVVAETRLFALFLDDLHEADDSYAFPFRCLQGFNGLTELLILCLRSSTQRVEWYGRIRYMACLIVLTIQQLIFATIRSDRG